MTSFAIEVPGNANPLTLQSLFQTLQSATSHDHNQRQAAGRQIQSWEECRGFLPSLQTIYLDKSLPLDVRFQAIIQLKNNVERYWRLAPHVRHGLDREQKDIIRSRLFQGTVDEDEKSLALHNALVVAKVVRCDFPRDWSEALSDIITLLRMHSQGGQSQRLNGTLLMLFRVMKEMGSIKVRQAQLALHANAPELVLLVANIYDENVAFWTKSVEAGIGNEYDIGLSLQNSLFAIKILRRLILIGFDHPHHDPTVCKLWSLTHSHFACMMDLVNRKDAPVSAPHENEVGKHLLQFAKLHLDMACQYPAGFAALPDVVPLVRAYWNLVSTFSINYDKSDGIRVTSTAGASEEASVSEAKSKIEGPLPERLALQGLLLMRACLRIAFTPTHTFKYRSTEAKEEERVAIDLIKNQVLGPPFAMEMTDVIVSRLFVFRRSDLEAWNESPEEWEHQEQFESNAYQWEVRPCAQKLFLDLITHYKDTLIPHLLSYFALAAPPGGQSDLSTKDAVYTAMGLAAAHMPQKFDFEALLSTTLVADVQIQGPLSRVLRRRVAILVSQWAIVEISDASKPVVYELFRHLMNPSDATNNDVVVRITAGRQLKWILDILDFKVDAFEPFAGDILTWLMGLVATVEIDETKLALLESARLLLSRMDSRVSQLGGIIMTTLPQVWSASGAERFMIKQAIIAIFTAFVVSAGEESRNYQSIMVPLITEAASPGTPLHQHLIEEALELWNGILTQSPIPLSAEVLHLAPLALPMLEYGLPTSSEALAAVTSYMLLEPGGMLSDVLRVPTLVALSHVLFESRSVEQVHQAAVCAGYMIRFAADLSLAEGTSVEELLGSGILTNIASPEPVAGLDGSTGGIGMRLQSSPLAQLIQEMIEVGTLGKIMERLHSTWEANQSTGPNRKANNLNVVTQGDYFEILARVAMADPGLFVMLLDSFGGLETIWPWLSEEWFTYQRSCGRPEQGKLMMLGLTRMLELGEPAQALILGRLQDFYATWTEMLAQLQFGAFDFYDALVWPPVNDAGSEAEWETPRSRREMMVARHDPVHSVSAMGFVSDRIRGVRASVGGQARFESEWIVNVDRQVMEDFQSVMKEDLL